YFQSTMSGTYEVIIYKFNSNNDLQWSTHYGSTMSDNVAWPGRALAMDDDDNLFVLMNIVGGGPGGGTFPTYDPGGGAFYQDQSKMFDFYNSAIGKFNSNGVRQWVTVMSHESVNTVDQDYTVWGIFSKNNKIYFTGISGQANSNTIPLRSLSGAYYQPSEIGSVCPFVGRFSNLGVLEWNTYLHSGNSGYSAYNGQGIDIQADAINNLWFIGVTSTSAGSGQGHLTMDPGGAYYKPTTLGSSDIIFTKFDASLQPVWSSYYGGGSTDNVYGVTSDSKGNLFIAGYTYSSDIDTYDPGSGAYYRASTANNSSVTNNFIAKFSFDYQLDWATTYSENSIFYGVEIGSADNLYVYGTSPGTAFVAQSETGSYNDNSYNGGTSDYVFLKFDAANIIKWATFYGGSDYEGSGITGRDAMNVYFNPCATTSKIVMFGGTQSTDFPVQNPGGGALFQGTKTSVSMGPVIVQFNETATSGISIAPTGISASTNPICSGSSTTLSVSGGSLGTGATWEWYSGSCGGTSAGTGASIIVSPTSTTTYYVQAVGTCNTTACVSQTITVSANSTAPTSLSASPTTICSGSSSTLTVGGGSLGDGASWYLYSGSCSGTLVSSNTTGTFSVSPATTTTYYVLASGTCNTTTCTSVTITVNSSSVDPTNISTPNTTICQGSSATLTVNGGLLGLGADWIWYENGCGSGSSIGNGSSIIVSPSSTIVYYVRAEGACNNTSCVSIVINVTSAPDAGTNGLISVCEGEPSFNMFSELGGTPSGGGTWTDSGGNPVSNMFNPSTQSSGVFTYTVTGTSPCSDATATVSVTVNPLPIVSFIGLNSVYCGAGDPILLTGNHAPDGSFTGLDVTDLGNGTAGYSHATTGINTVTYTYTDINGCTASDIQTVTVNPLP
ncbi:MAG: SBBP repeat-containing protein, partial [Bacteroidota bacterium]